MSKEFESALARFGNKSEQANHSCFWKDFYVRSSSYILLDCFTFLRLTRLS